MSRCMGRCIGHGRGHCLRIAALLAALAVAAPALAADYPDHPVKIIVPFPPGGSTDIAARLIAPKLAERLGKQFYIENIGGAGGNIGMTDAARAPGDGYTILFRLRALW